MLKLVQHTEHQLYTKPHRFLWRVLISIFLIVISGIYSDIKAQNVSQTIISIDVKDTNAAEILESIYKQYNIKIAYNSSELSTIYIKEYKADNQSIDKIINDLLKNSEFSSKHIGNQIVIFKDEEKHIPKKEPKEILSKEERLKLIVRDTIHHFDTIVVTKIETVQKIDTVKVYVEKIDTVFMNENVHEKLISKLFVKNVKHDEQFSLRLSYSQQLSFLTFKTKNENKREIVNLLEDAISCKSLRSTAINIDGAYSVSDWNITVGISYNSYRHKFSFHEKEYEDPYYVLDTLDSYYNIDIHTFDTTFYHIIDTSYMSGNIHNYNHDEINKLSYLGFNVGIAYTFFKSQYFSFYFNTSANLDILINAKGAYISEDKTERVKLFDKNDFNKVKFACNFSLGSKISITESLDLIPEIYYKHYFGSITKNADFKTNLDVLGIKLGVCYYF